MIYSTWDRDRDDFSLHFYVSTFIRPPPKHEPPDPLAGPQFLIGPLRPSSWPLDPSAGVLTLQLAFQKLWMPSWPSIWPDRPSSWTLDPPIYLSDHLAGLSDRIKQNSTEFNKIQQNSAKFNKIQLQSTLVIRDLNGLTDFFPYLGFPLLQICICIEKNNKFNSKIKFYRFKTVNFICLNQRLF